MKVDRLEIEQAENGFIIYARWQDLTNRFVALDWGETQEILHRVEWVRQQQTNGGPPAGVPERAR